MSIILIEEIDHTRVVQTRSKPKLLLRYIKENRNIYRITKTNYEQNPTEKSNEWVKMLLPLSDSFRRKIRPNVFLSQQERLTENRMM